MICKNSQIWLNFPKFQHFWPATHRTFAAFLTARKPAFLRVGSRFLSLPTWSAIDFFFIYACRTRNAIALQSDIFQA